MSGRFIYALFRSENSIKNRFYGLVKKAWRQLGRVEKIKKIKGAKSIKF